MDRTIDITKPTPTQIKILQLLSQGNDLDEIGEKLHISPATAKTHIQMAYFKMNVHSRSHAVAVCLRNGWIE